MDVFKVSFLVEDKHLGSVLRSLAGRVKNVEQVPVTNLKMENGQPQEIVSGGLSDQFFDWLRKNKKREFTVADAREFLKAQGRGPGSQSYILKQLLDARQITQHGKSAATFYRLK